MISFWIEILHTLKLVQFWFYYLDYWSIESAYQGYKCLLYSKSSLGTVGAHTCFHTKNCLCNSILLLYSVFERSYKDKHKIDIKNRYSTDIKI